MRTREQILAEISEKLPENWEQLNAEQQMHYLLIAADKVLLLTGNWILVNGKLSLKELMSCTCSQDPGK